MTLLPILVQDAHLDGPSAKIAAMAVIVINVQMANIMVKSLELLQSRRPRQFRHVQFLSAFLGRLSQQRLGHPVKIEAQFGEPSNRPLAQFSLLSADVQFSLRV